MANPTIIEDSYSNGKKRRQINLPPHSLSKNPKIKKGDASTGVTPRRVSPTVRRNKLNPLFPAKCASERTLFTERTGQRCECGERSAASRKNACIFSEHGDFVDTLSAALLSGHFGISAISFLPSGSLHNMRSHCRSRSNRILFSVF